MPKVCLNFNFRRLAFTARAPSYLITNEPHVQEILMSTW